MVLVSAAAASAALSVSPFSWVVIVAGSNGYQNYRHQADACHAYQVARGNGIPADHIILMMYDDVAHNEGNPFPGKLFNQVDGQDVYAGCVLDYTGMDTTMANFFNVLHGKSSVLTDGRPAGRVLNSTIEDNVFIYYTDHGAPGYVTFPAGPAMYAPDLQGALTQMHSLGKYKQLLFYMDACNSGSMFASGLLKAPNVLAVAAAKATEESFAAFCPPYDKVKSENNRETFSCLGDVMSINWMVDASAAKTSIETVASQIDTVSNETALNHTLNRDHNSHVEQFGDMSIRAEMLAEFQGPGSSALHQSTRAPLQGVVSKRDVPLHLARYTLQRASTPAARTRATAAYHTVLAARSAADQVYPTIAKLAAQSGSWGYMEAAEMLQATEMTIPNVDFECYKWALGEATKWCGPMDDYSMQYSALFANLCITGGNRTNIVQAIHTGCKKL